MTIEIANRLCAYRKNRKLSQEVLAEKLGVTRQAVSKWERAEASPDTDKLILLSKTYEVTLDDLINKDPVAVEKFNYGKVSLNKETDLPGRRYNQHTMRFFMKRSRRLLCMPIVIRCYPATKSGKIAQKAREYPQPNT